MSDTHNDIIVSYLWGYGAPIELSNEMTRLKEENKRLREALRNVTDDAECAFGVLIDLGNGCTHPMETIEAFADELEKSLSTANKLLLKEE